MVKVLSFPFSFCLCSLFFVPCSLFFVLCSSLFSLSYCFLSSGLPSSHFVFVFCCFFAFLFVLGDGVYLLFLPTVFAFFELESFRFLVSALVFSLLSLPLLFVLDFVSCFFLLCLDFYLLSLPLLFVFDFISYFFLLCLDFYLLSVSLLFVF